MSRMRGWVALMAMCAARAGGQQWLPGASIDLIRRAAAHRVARDADTLLSAWRAEAHGVLRYAMELDHGEGPVERVIRADELRIEVYGESPNLSKQFIRAWRDTSFLPNRISYHRDHLGIVANDFGSTIRLGQGDEVRDVPHPLSEAGLAGYLFALGDTVTLHSAAGRVRVVAVQVRPRDPESSGAVGTLYLDVDRAALVRFRFTFTPASYRDRTVAAITVLLENALQKSDRWLPWRQSIVIRRGFPLFDFPFRTVIRADWTIDDYALGVHHLPGLFAGPPLAGPLWPMGGAGWDAPMAARLDALPATDADVADIVREASGSLAGHSLSGLPQLRLLGAGISDVLHVNRVEGVTPAIGLHLGIGDAVVLRGRIGIGLSDRRMIGGVSLVRKRGETTWLLQGERVVRDVADAPIMSGVENSLATIASGDDHGDYTLVERIGVGYAATTARRRASVSTAEEWSTSVRSTFTPLNGTSAPNPVLGAGAAWVTRATISTRDPAARGWSLDLETGVRAAEDWFRVHGTAGGRVPLPRGVLLLSAEAGAGWGELPGYRTFVLGGIGTLLGVPFRALGGTRMARAEVAWAIPVALPTPPFPYSRATRLASVLAPYLAAGVVGGERAGVPWRATGRVEPVAGLRLDLWGPLLRVETGVSLRTGGVGVAFDVHPDWWGVM